MGTPVAAKHFQAQSMKCLTEPKYADFTIRTDANEYQVNRQLLSCHSAYFSRLFENEFEESAESCVHLQDDGEIAIGHLMTYFYTFDYGNKDTVVKEHVEVYLVADKYEVPDLRTLSTQKLRKDAMVYYDSAPVGSFLPIIEFVYENTTASHKDIRAVATNMWLCGNRAPANDDDTQELKSALSKLPAFTADLAIVYAMSYSESYKVPVKMQCVCGSYGGVERSFSALATTQCCFCRSDTRWKEASIRLAGNLQIEPYTMYSPGN